MSASRVFPPLAAIKYFDYNTIIILKKNVLKKLKIKSNSYFISAEIIIKSFFYKFSFDYSKKLKLSPYPCIASQYGDCHTDRDLQASSTVPHLLLLSSTLSK